MERNEIIMGNASFEHEEKISRYSDKINYDQESVTVAFKHLKNMQELEDTPKFGVFIPLESKYKNKRYSIEKYKDKIDSTFYTDTALTILAHNIKFFSSEFGEKYPSDIYTYIYEYFSNGTHDLVNNSEGEFATFQGDFSFFDNHLLIPDSLYAYYSEFQLVTGDEKKDVFTSNHFTDEDFNDRIVLKRVEDINGVAMDFYYVGSCFSDISGQLLQHDYNIKFLREKMPANVLNAAVAYTGRNDIITLTNDYFSMYIENVNPDWVAFAMPSDGNIVVRDGCYFDEVILHEIGHLFDSVDIAKIGALQMNYRTDYMKFSLGKWNRLAGKYADEIYNIRVGANIGCGYSEEKMLKMNAEFYAEAFQLYFYNDETRAALPEAVKKQIEKEIRKYAK